MNQSGQKYEQPKQEEHVFVDLAPFKIPPQELEEIFNLTQRRNKCEELDYIQEKEGLDWLYNGLLTSKTNGISNDQASKEKRIKVYGSNQRVIRPPKSYFELLWDALQDFTMKVLMAASIFNIAIEVGSADEKFRSTAWIEGFSIFIAVLVCTNVAASNDYSKEKQFRALNKMQEKDKLVTVIRDKQESRIHEDLVLTGDIVKLVEGMEIPADGVIIESSEILIDESSMTGETQPIKKQTMEVCIQCKRDADMEGKQFGEQDRFELPSPAILSGTKVLEGEGLYIVCVVGDASCLGKIRSVLENEDTEPTPLQEKLTEIAEDIGKFGLYSAILIVIVLLIRFAIERGMEQEWDNRKHWIEILQFFILGIVVLAVAIPEGLPLSVTLSLAYSVQKMMKDKNLVRKMYACETMGGADTICSDKTGTLTKNIMQLTMIWNKEYFKIDANAKNHDIKTVVPSTLQQLLIQSFCSNSSAEMFPEQVGSKTDIALLEYIEKCGFSYKEQRNSVSVIKKIPFNSSRKRMSVIIESVENGTPKKRILVKGASEIILESLTSFHDFKDKIQVMDSQTKASIVQAIQTMARQSMRTLCIAYKDLNGTEDLNKCTNKIYEVESKNLTFFAIVGIMDNLRDNVDKAVAQCRLAGITVRMITGDNKETARAIAIQCGIIPEGDPKCLVMEGPEFMNEIGGVICKACKTEKCPCARSQDDAKKRKVPIRIDTIGKMHIFKSLYPNLLVLARSRPQDKYAMIVGLKECSHVVAVTGDGTNDALALKKADVGFAMGITGTQVAKDAAAIILMEDNFNDIVKSVMWGRNIFQSVRKFLQFQLTVNIVAVFLTLITAAVIKQHILSPIQMLWVNLIMDSFASLALATEPPNIILLKDKPYKRNQYIVTKKMFKHIIGQSILQFAILLMIVFSGEQWIPEYTDLYDLDTSIPFKVEYKYNMEYYPDLIARSGRMRTADGATKDYEDVYDKTHVPSRHFTMIFNTFVMLQYFNFFNARKLNDELNIFEGLGNNMLFIIILVFVFSCQVIIVTFGGRAFHCYPYYGLQIQHWLICMGFGMLGWFVSVILKFIPEEKLCPQFGKSEEDEEGMPKRQSSRILDLRRGSKRISHASIPQQQQLVYQASIKE